MVDYRVNERTIFTGRGNDAMRIGGENVSALEVEAVLDSHPAVLEIAVFAVAGELGEDGIKADIRPARQIFTLWRLA